MATKKDKTPATKKTNKQESKKEINEEIKQSEKQETEKAEKKKTEKPKQEKPEEKKTYNYRGPLSSEYGYTLHSGKLLLPVSLGERLVRRGLAFPVKAETEDDKK